jgi:hypothetical protein
MMEKFVKKKFVNLKIATKMVDALMENATALMGFGVQIVQQKNV